MSDIDWVKIDSWHIIEMTTRGGGKRTICGRYIASPTVVDLSQRLPLGEKSCETCARLILSREDPDGQSPEIETESAPDENPESPPVGNISEEY